MSESQPLPDEALRDRGAVVMAHISSLGHAVRAYRYNEDTGREQVELADGWHNVGDLLANASGKP